jgi:hypothetical protein
MGRTVLVINFAHPMTESQIDRLKGLTGYEVAEVRDVPSQLDNERHFAPQITELVDAVGLSAEEWQTREILINPPAYAPAASILIAELHGRMGYFPTIIRIRPATGSTPLIFEVAEITNLQEIRSLARKRRT